MQRSSHEVARLLHSRTRGHCTYCKNVRVNTSHEATWHFLHMKVVANRPHIECKAQETKPALTYQLARKG